MKRPIRHAFSMTEMLVVIAVLVALLGLLFPLMSGVRKSGQMTKSMSNLRQVAGWLTLYAGDHRDFIIPSQFDYSQNAYPGTVRSTVTDVLLLNKLHAGTWADIIWSEYRLGVFPEAVPDFAHDYRHDSPDGPFYGQKVDGLLPVLSIKFDNPLRSEVHNTRNSPGGISSMDAVSSRMLNIIATPFGGGAAEKRMPGYFAANNFFNTDAIAKDARTPSRPLPGPRWYAHGQIRMPERSMYLVDSFAGEVIQPWAERYKADPGGQPDPTPEIKPENRVDFRYSDQCLMLFLDGHSETQTRWDGIEELEGYAGNPITYDPANRRVRIRELDKRISSVFP